MQRQRSPQGKKAETSLLSLIAPPYFVRNTHPFKALRPYLSYKRKKSSTLTKVMINDASGAPYSRKEIPAPCMYACLSLLPRLQTYPPLRYAHVASCNLRAFVSRHMSGRV